MQHVHCNHCGEFRDINMPSFHGDSSLFGLVPFSIISIIGEYCNNQAIISKLKDCNKQIITLLYILSGL